MNRRFRLTLLIIAFIGLLWFLWRIRKLLTPLFLAAVISYLLLPVVGILEKRQVPRPFAIILVYAIGAVVGGIALSILVPFLSTEIESLLSTLPEQTARLEGFTLEWLNKLRGKPSLPAAFREGIETVVLQVERSLARVMERVVSSLMGLFTSVFYIILSPILAYFIMRDWPMMLQSFIRLFPARYHEGLTALSGEVNRILAGFIRGQLVVSLVIGLIIAGGLSILGVRYALIVGLIAGAFEIIPYFGPIIGAVPAVLLALLNSPTTALWTVGLFLVVNQLESVILSPKIVGEFVGLHPLTVIFAILAGAELAGIIGMLLAVPLTAILKVVADFFMHWMVGEAQT